MMPNNMIAIRLPGKTIRFVLLEDVLSLNMQRLFPGFDVLGKGMFRLAGLDVKLTRPRIWSGRKHVTPAPARQCDPPEDQRRHA